MEIIRDNTNILYEKNVLIIENPQGLRTMGLCQIRPGIQETKRVVYSRDKDMVGGGVGSASPFEKITIKSHGRVTCIIGVGDSFLDLLAFIDDGVGEEELIYYFKVLLESKDEILGPLLKFYDSNTILVIGRKGESVHDNIPDQIKDCISDSLSKVLRSRNLGIVEQLKNEGIILDELVKAGMDLCVGVKITNELKNKLRKQLIKSLSDINVVALIIAAMRVEEDFYYHRMGDVDVDDDPVHLYSDEVLGMAVANQIAGTKAIFNFKRYDEEKPGIIGGLGPMMDDVIAGLVAGSMSKIFEE